MIKAVSKKSGICVVEPLWAVAIFWLEGSGNGRTQFSIWTLRGQDSQKGLSEAY